MEKNKDKGKSSLVTSMAVVVALIAFMGGYVLSGNLHKSYFKMINNDDNDSSMEGIEIAGVVRGGSTDKTLGFDERNVVSGDEYDYNINLGSYSGTGDSYINLNYGDDKSEIMIAKNYYDNENTEYYSIEFDNNVVDVHISMFNMDPDYSVIFFLLDDGSIEYLLVEKAMETGNFGEITEVAELNKIVKFYDGTSCEKGTTVCIETTFAQDANGKIFDLYRYIF